MYPSIVTTDKEYVGHFDEGVVLPAETNMDSVYIKIYKNSNIDPKPMQPFLVSEKFLPDMLNFDSFEIEISNDYLAFGYEILNDTLLINKKSLVWSSKRLKLEYVPTVKSSFRVTVKETNQTIVRPIDGWNNLSSYLSANINPPRVTNLYLGKIIVEFSVNKSGKV